MQCQKCGAQNEDTYRFCMKCGSPLSPPQTNSFQEPVEQKNDPPSETFIPRSNPATPSFVSKYEDEKSYQSPQVQTQQAQKKEGLTITFPSGNQVLSAFSIWGPFAGKGTRQQHMGWLMDNKADSHQGLVEKVNAKLNERSIPDAKFTHEILSTKDLLVEKRPYFLVRRGLTCVALNISKFGKDLFISIASYLKPPISNFRVALLTFSLFFALLMTVVYPAALNSSVSDLISSINVFGNNNFSTTGLITLICFVGPLGAINYLALAIFFIFGFYKWLVEKDFWAGLRVTPNEFNQDDLMALEKAVEQTVRISMDEIGLDPDELNPIRDEFNRRII